MITQKQKKKTHKEHNLYTHGLYRWDESCVYKVTNALKQKHVAADLSDAEAFKAIVSHNEIIPVE